MHQITSDCSRLGLWLALGPIWVRVRSDAVCPMWDVWLCADRSHCNSKKLFTGNITTRIYANNSRTNITATALNLHSIKNTHFRHTFLSPTSPTKVNKLRPLRSLSVSYTAFSALPSEPQKTYGGGNGIRTFT